VETRPASPRHTRTPMGTSYQLICVLFLHKKVIYVKNLVFTSNSFTGLCRD
jgi:hypothetical protein